MLSLCVPGSTQQKGRRSPGTSVWGRSPEGAGRMAAPRGHGGGGQERVGGARLRQRPPQRLAREATRLRSPAGMARAPRGAPTAARGWGRPRRGERTRGKAGRRGGGAGGGMLALSGGVWNRGCPSRRPRPRGRGGPAQGSRGPVPKVGDEARGMDPGSFLSAAWGSWPRPRTPGLVPERTRAADRTR